MQHSPRAPIGADRLQGSAPAAPFASVDAAVEAALAPLLALGLGRWRLVVTSAEEPHDPDELSIALVVPEERRMYALRADEAPIGELDVDAVTVVRGVARTVASLLSTARRAERSDAHAAKAERESSTDSLTGLASPRAWWRALSREADRCDRHDLTALVAVVDLDGLKKVNDAHGHLEGDALLRVAGGALTDAVRAHDLVARVGGDEFGVLAVDYQTLDGEEMVARIQQHLTASGVLASIGTARHQAGGRMTDTFREADAAMYRAKRSRAQAAASRPDAPSEEVVSVTDR